MKKKTDNDKRKKETQQTGPESLKAVTTEEFPLFDGLMSLYGPKRPHRLKRKTVKGVFKSPPTFLHKILYESSSFTSTFQYDLIC